MAGVVHGSLWVVGGVDTDLQRLNDVRSYQHFCFTGSRDEFQTTSISIYAAEFDFELSNFQILQISKVGGFDRIWKFGISKSNSGNLEFSQLKILNSRPGSAEVPGVGGPLRRDRRLLRLVVRRASIGGEAFPRSGMAKASTVG